MARGICVSISTLSPQVVSSRQKERTTKDSRMVATCARSTSRYEMSLMIAAMRLNYIGGFHAPFLCVPWDGNIPYEWSKRSFQYQTFSVHLCTAMAGCPAKFFPKHT
eukprot:2566108-Amphidinium_carterae.2